jgi:hypothetical protein
VLGKRYVAAISVSSASHSLINVSSFGARASFSVTNASISLRLARWKKPGSA